MTVCVPSLSLQNTGWSPLFFAAQKGDVATTNLLLKAGANALLKDKVSSIQSSVWCVAVLYCVCHSLQNNATALDVAKVHRHKEVYELLAQHIKEVSGRI